MHSCKENKRMLILKPDIKGRKQFTTYSQEFHCQQQQQ